MALIVVPHTVGTSTANVWVGATGKDLDSRTVTLEFDDGEGGGGVKELHPSSWERWRSWLPEDREAYRSWRRLEIFKPTVRTLAFRRVDIGPLKPRTPYELRLKVDGQIGDSEDPLRKARVTTLPEELPRKGEKPFTLLLGSCFYQPLDSSGRVGALYDRLPEEERPDVKILCGDQVYLDNPWPLTTLFWYGGFSAPGVFRARLFKKYLATWTHSPAEGAGFRRLLANGANYFCSDDHEFWNNAPNFGGVGMINTLTDKDRKWWFKEATRLFRAFQAPKPLERFDVGSLSVCVADTRIDRDPAGNQFMCEEHLQEVKQWIHGLEGPGVLALGQPLLTKETVHQRDTGALKGLRGRLVPVSFDRTLPDYHRQYEALVGQIRSSRHSIVVLTGDVHFGRFAHGELRPGSEGKMVEVIASPMQAVSGLRWTKPLFGGYEDAPTDRFPGLRSCKATDRQNHFATVRFSSNGGGQVDMEVKYWPIPATEGGLEAEPQAVFTIELS